MHCIHSVKFCIFLFKIDIKRDIPCCVEPRKVIYSGVALLGVGRASFSHLKVDGGQQILKIFESVAIWCWPFHSRQLREVFFICSFIHSSKKYSLTVYQVSGNVLGARDAAVNKAEQQQKTNPSFMGFLFQLGETNNAEVYFRENEREKGVGRTRL